MTSRVFSLAAFLILAAAGAGEVHAQPSGQKLGVFEGVGMTEKLGGSLPLDLTFRDETGRTVKLGDYFGGEHPVVLNLVYHSCPMLCNLVLDGTTAAMKGLDWTPGDEFTALAISFSPAEGPEESARAKERYTQMLGKPEAASGWHFLTGSEESIQALTSAVGFEYKWVEAQQEYAHPAVVTFLSGEGKITRYLYGLDIPSRTMRTALLEASEGKIGSPLDQAILFCFQYDPSENSYVPDAINLMKAGGGLTLLALGSFLLFFWRRERRRSESTLDLPVSGMVRP